MGEEMNLEGDNIVSDVWNTLNICLNSYERKCEQASEKVGQLTSRIDEVLDKSFVEGQPNVCCGDVLDQVKEVLDDTARQIKYAKQIVIAKILAWEYYDRDDDQWNGRIVRDGYVAGFMSSKDFNQ